jgi:hypothetical protein
MSSNGPITLRHLQVVLDYTRQEGAITNRSFRSLTGLSYDQAIKVFHALCNMGMLQKVGDGPTTKYIIPMPREKLDAPPGRRRGE